LQVLASNGWIARHWTNNSAESANHLLKLKADWRQLPVNSCVENVYDIWLLYVELRSALSGRGNYTLVPAFSRHLVPYQTWATAAAEKKDEWFAKFLRDTGARVHDKAVKSQDGGLTMPATIGGGAGGRGAQPPPDGVGGTPCTLPPPTSSNISLTPVDRNKAYCSKKKTLLERG